MPPRKKKANRLERLEEALYSRNENRLPQRERATLTPSDYESTANTGFLNDIPLEDIVSQEREHPHRKLFEKIFLISLGFVLIAAGFAGYKFFLGGPSVSDKNLNIIIGGPSIVSAGSPVSLDIRVENTNARSIEKATLKITYPKDSRSVDDRSKVLSTDTIDIGTLGSGKTSGKQVSFIVYGQKDESEVLNTRLEYQITGSNAIFVKEVPFSIVIGTAPVILNVTVPKTVVSRQPFDATVVVKSNSPDAINNVELTADFPFGYVLTSSEPKVYQDNNIWKLGDMPSGDTKTIHIHGSLEAENNEERTFKFTVSVGGGTFGGNVNSQIASELETVAVSKPFLSITAGVVGGAQGSTQAGDRIPIEITWTNNLSVPVTNAIVKATISGVFDQNGILPQYGGFYNSKDQSITWQQSSNDDLKSIAPGGTGSVRFALPIPKILPTDAKNQGVAVHAVITADQTGADTTQQVSSDTDLSFKFRANPTSSAYASRVASPFAQTGPIPPRVNNATTYSVVLNAGTSFADVDNATLTANLPPNVSWNNIVSPGSERITFDNNSRVLVWSVGNISAGESKKAIIQLTITPSLLQAGIVPSLLTRISFVGTDSFTSEPISLDIDDVTTELLHDTGVIDNAGVVAK
ncbi:MAG: hypothetical protein WA051_00755 [Minisyncoccia bacterium]